MKKIVKVLWVVENDEDVSLPLELLEFAGISVESRILKLLQKLETEITLFYPDVVICDTAIGLDNYIVLRRRMDATGFSIPFVLVSDSIEDDAAIEYLHFGIDDLIDKGGLQRLPYSILNLVEKYAYERERNNLVKQTCLEQQAAQQAMKELADRLLLATRAAGLAMWEYRIEADEISFNDEVPALFGRKAEELGTSFSSWVPFFHPDDLPAMIQAIEECRLTKKDQHLEYRILLPDGNYRYVRATTITQCMVDSKEHKITGTLQDITREKLEEQRLMESENKYRSIFENSMDAILLTAPDGSVLQANHAATVIFQMTEEEICRAGRHGLVVADDASADIIRQRNEKGEARGVITMKRKNGSLFPAEIATSLYQNETGKPLTTVILRDISERIKLEATLARERERYSELFNETPSCVGVYRGPDFIYEMVNPHYLKVTGRQADIIGKSVKDVMPELKSQGIIELLETVYTTGKKFVGKEKLVRFDTYGTGQLVDHYLDFIFIPHFNEENKVDAILFFSNNVTEQVLLRKAVEESEMSYRKIFECSPLPKFLIEENTLKVLEINEAALRHYGYGKEEFGGMMVTDLFDPSYAASVRQYFQHVKGNSGTAKILKTLRKKNGDEMIAELNAVNFTYKGADCFLITINDITEQTLLQHNLAQLKISAQKKILRSQIKGQEDERAFLGRELHDNVNQQLCTAQLYLGVARMQPDKKDEMINSCEKIVKSAINDIRKLCKSMVPPSLQDVGFMDTVKELVECFSTAQKFAILLEEAPEMDQLPKELQLALYRIVQEQLTNISKYANAGHVWIKFALKENVLSLSIKDDGVGFDVKTVKKGVGLANIKNRIGLFGGKVRIKSSPGKGCLMQVQLILQNECCESIKKSLAIVVAEDDILDQELLQQAAGDLDEKHSLRFVSTGKQLITYLDSLDEQQLPSLIVLDFNLPGMNALQTMEVLNTNTRYRPIPKVVYSTSHFRSDENKCLMADAKAYIKKGSSIDEIKNNFREMISYCN